MPKNLIFAAALLLCTAAAAQTPLITSHSQTIQQAGRADALTSYQVCRVYTTVTTYEARAVDSVFIACPSYTAGYAIERYQHHPTDTTKQVLRLKNSSDALHIHHSANPYDSPILGALWICKDSSIYFHNAQNN